MTAESFVDLLRIHAASAVALQDQFEQVGIGPFHQDMKELKLELARSNTLREKLSIELDRTREEARCVAEAARAARASLARLRDHIQYLESLSGVHQSDEYTILKKEHAELVQVNATLHRAFNESQKECSDIKNRVREIADLWKKFSKGAL